MPIDTPKITEENEKSNIQEVPVCNDENIINKLLSQSKIEAFVFKAEIVLENPDYLDREFIVKYFPSEQSVSVSEMKIKTAGRFSSMF